jgi:HD-GYP domain-containing protein (c-di-GMP phosphodiesterase class II)
MTSPDTGQPGSLAEENRRLRQQIADMKNQVSGQESRNKPIEGMMKLLKSKNEQIEKTVQELRSKNLELQQSYEQTVRYYKNTVTALSSAMEAKSPYFQFHSSNVESICRKTAGALSLGRKEIDELSTAALVHDFGNISIRSEVLLKEGPLTPEEYEHVKTHALAASLILEPIGSFSSIIQSVKHHHENFDGSGYPEGISGDAIPLHARIIYLAESFDALTSARPYREPLPQDLAAEEIRANSGTRYDPAIVDALLSTLS